MHQLRIVEHRSEVSDRLCPCGCAAEAVTVGHEVSWRLEHKPAELYRMKVVREKVAFPQHAGPGKRLLAQIVIDKYADLLPLFRQEARFKRQGIDLSRTTLCGWAMELAELLRPVWKHMSREVLGGDWVRADATGMPVIDKTRSRGKAHKGQLWAWGNYETVP